MSELAVKDIVEKVPYKIKDIGLAKDGRNSIEKNQSKWDMSNLYQYTRLKIIKSLALIPCQK